MSVAYADKADIPDADIRDELRLAGEVTERAQLDSRSRRAYRDALIVQAYDMGMTQTDIARLLHVHQSLVSRVVTAHRRELALTSPVQPGHNDHTEGAHR